MRTVAGTFVGFVAMIALAAGCGGGDGGRREGEHVVTMGKPSEYAMTPAPAEISAGTVTFQVKNEGTLVHEMVVIKTDKGAANLWDGRRGRRERRSRRGGRPPRGRVEDAGVDLGGREVLLSSATSPWHYAAGMYADFTVK